MIRIKLFIVDDHQMLIDGIKALLKNEKSFEVVGEATRSLKALELIPLLLPDVIITDINMPEVSGIELTKKIRKKYPRIKILALSMHNDKNMITEMLDAGVSGYILKNTGKQELISALNKIVQGEVFFSNEVSAEMMKALSEKDQNKNAEQKISLTPREIEIVKLISKEFSNARIAEDLFISERTVETHRKNIFRKTNTKSVVGLIKYAYENKYID